MFEKKIKLWALKEKKQENTSYVYIDKKKQSHLLLAKILSLSVKERYNKKKIVLSNKDKIQDSTQQFAVLFFHTTSKAVTNFPLEFHH